MTDLPEELQEAMELLDSYRVCTNHEEKNEDFRNAFEVIQDFLEDCPETTFKKNAESLKARYVVSFLGELPNLSHLDIDDWLYYSITMSLWRNDFRKEMAEVPTLKAYYEDFTSVWKDEVPELILGYKS